MWVIAFCWKAKAFWIPIPILIHKNKPENLKTRNNSLAPVLMDYTSLQVFNSKLKYTNIPFFAFMCILLL